MTGLSSKTITYTQLAKVIDHSLLRPELTEQEVVEGCKLAARYNTATVCVKPTHVKLAAVVLKGSDVKVSTVVGFPHGSNLTATKVAEAQAAMDDGAVELDMVLNIGALRSGQADFVRDDIQAVCSAAHTRGVKVKVIFENAYLNEAQKDPGMPAMRAGRGRLGQDLHRFCAERGDPGGSALDAGQCQREGAGKGGWGCAHPGGDPGSDRCRLHALRGNCHCGNPG